MNLTFETGSDLYRRTPAFTSDRKMFGMRFSPKDRMPGEPFCTLIRNWAIRQPEEEVRIVAKDGDLYKQTITDEYCEIPSDRLKLMMKHYDINIQRKIKPIQEIKKLGHDWEIVYIVGNGPGLADNWEAIKNRKRGVVLACNRALNIIPSEYVDFWMSVDVKSPIKYISETDCSKTIGLLDLNIHPEFIDAGFKDIYAFNCCFTEKYKGYHNRNYWSLEAAHSITYPMTFLAWLMGAKQIIFVGQDCCLGPDDIAHSGIIDHVQEAKSLVNVKDNIYECLGVGGETYRSYRSFAMIAEVTLSTCFFLALNKVFTYNASERGILCGGVSLIKQSNTLGLDGRPHLERHRFQVIEQVKLADIVRKMNELPRSAIKNREWSLFNGRK